MAHEYVGNLHAHTRYSDGYGGHNDVAQAALEAGLDFVATTDHNVLVRGVNGYRYIGDRRVLLFTGEEIHDPNRQPQRNHLLVYGVDEELAPLAYDPHKLVDAVDKRDGLSFLAHPMDQPAAMFKTGDLSWVAWDVGGYTGLEIWNFMTEFKSYLNSWPSAFYYAYRPDRIGAGPFPAVMARWDRLLTSGQKVVAIGGADAHALPVRKGPFRRVVFPFAFLFRTVNTHVLTRRPLTGDSERDQALILDALRRGACFVGYDLPAPTRGFRFTAQGEDDSAGMGDSLRLRFGVTLQIRTPRRCIIRLLHNGEALDAWQDVAHCACTVGQPGIYRVEASIRFKGRQRTWIVSNPIYVTE